MATPPKAVSPFIRACRWGALGAGLLYGVFRLSYLERKEVKIQAYENKIKEARAIQLAIEHEQRSRQEMIDLARDAGLPAEELLGSAPVCEQ